MTDDDQAISDLPARAPVARNVACGVMTAMARDLDATCTYAGGLDDPYQLHVCVTWRCGDQTYGLVRCWDTTADEYVVSIAKNAARVFRAMQDAKDEKDRQVDLRSLFLRAREGGG